MTCHRGIFSQSGSDFLWVFDLYFIHYGCIVVFSADMPGIGIAFVTVKPAPFEKTHFVLIVAVAAVLQKREIEDCDMIRFICIVIFVILFLIVTIPVLIIESVLHKFRPYESDISSLRIVQWPLRLLLKSREWT